MRRFLFSFCVSAALVAGASKSSAQVTASQSQGIDIQKTLSYQGFIASKNGQPAKDGDYTVTVNLYTDKDGSRSFWQDTYTAHVVAGVFSIQLGSGLQPLPAVASFDGPIFVGISINGEEMKPLTPLSAVPYAMN